MDAPEASPAWQARPRRIDVAGFVVALLSYPLILAAATWPAARWFTTALPALVDPLEHLWIMRWYKSCLLEGRFPLYCPDAHAPVGVPLGLYPPMSLETLFYLPISFFAMTPWPIT